MKILLVEDDWMQEEAIRDALVAAFDDVQVETIITESKFRNSIDSLVENPPDLVILDMMLRWEDPSPNLDDSWMDLEDSVVTQAGLRCYQLLADRVTSIRAIFYSILKIGEIGSEIPASVPYLVKEETLENLLEAVARLLKIQRRQL